MTKKLIFFDPNWKALRVLSKPVASTPKVAGPKRDKLMLLYCQNFPFHPNKFGALDH